MNKKFLGFVLALCSLSIKGSPYQSIQDYIKHQQDLREIQEKIVTNEISESDLEKIYLKEIQIVVKMIPEMMNPDFLNSEAGLLFIAHYGIELQYALFNIFKAPILEAQKYNASKEEIDKLSQQLYAQVGVNKQEVESAFDLLQKIPRVDKTIHQKLKDFLSQQR